MIIIPTVADRGHHYKPLVQSYPISPLTSNLNDYNYAPSGSEILNNFKQYMFSNTVGDPNPDAQFVLDGADITSTVNSNPINILISDTPYTDVYQTMTISSTNTDDDFIGWVLGSYTDSTSLYFLITYFVLSSSPNPTFKVFTLKTDKTALPSNITYYPMVNTDLKVGYVNYPASNADSFGGWTQAPWDTGVNVQSHFDGTTLTLKVYTPGQAPSSTNKEIDWSLKTVDYPALKNFNPIAGICVQSQINAYWKNYTINANGGTILNLETQTLWGPKEDTAPLEYIDLGIPLWQIVPPGKYAYDSMRDQYVKTDYNTHVTAVSQPPL